MSGKRAHLRKQILILAGVAAAAIVSVPQAVVAAGAGATGFTQVLHQVTQTFPGYLPCSTPPSTPPVLEQITISNENSVFHVTQLANGTFWGTGTFEGAFVAQPIDDASQPTYTGHVTVWFGDNNNLQNGSETSILSVRGTNSDGTTFVAHDVAHLSVSASGITFSFDKPTCH